MSPRFLEYAINAVKNEINYHKRELERVPHMAYFTPGDQEKTRVYHTRMIEEGQAALEALKELR